MSDLAVELRDGEASGLLNLRGAVQNAAFRERVADLLGVALPIAPHQCARGEAAAAYWLGPDEWLVAVVAGAEAGLETRLRQALVGGFAVTDTSGGYARFELGGTRAEDVLRKSSSCDFHPSAFQPNRCVQTVFGKTHALICLRPDRRWEIFVRASYAAYVRRWLAAAMAEYG